MEVQYQLKMKASRELLSEVGRKYPTMLFSLRGVEAKQARFGLVECLNHGLLAAYPVTYEKDGDLVAHVSSAAPPRWLAVLLLCGCTLGGGAGAHGGLPCLRGC
jgi:hypothetical protein